MAKQNVSFFERHMEKFIAGVCAAVLLVAFVIYTLDTPHGVKAGTETLGPSEFYGKFKAEVETAREKMQRAQVVDLAKPKLPSDMNQEAHALAVAKLPARLPSSFVFPSPDAPEIGIQPPPNAVDLARILPPVRPVLTAGRSTALLPQPIVGTYEAAEGRSGLGEVKEQGVQPQDCYWITVVSGLNRKQQREVFEAAKYNATRMALIVGAVDVERQELLPGGTWSAPQAIQPYLPWSVKPIGDLKMEEQEGLPNIPPDQATMLTKYREKIEDYNTQQQEILRPHFVNYLRSHAWDWKVPHKVEGMSVDMAIFGVEFPAEVTKRKPERPTVQPRLQPRTPSETAGAKGKPPKAAVTAPKPVKPETGAQAAAKEGESVNFKKAVTLKKEADDLLKSREKEADAAAKDKLLLQARDKLTELVKLSGPNEKDEKLAVFVKKAEEQLEQLQDEVQRIETQQQSETKQRAQQWAMNFGPDVDPMWVNDTTVAPGKSYRYRLRVKAVNNYAGLPGFLKKFQDACKVLIDGEWSEWSDAVTVPAAKQLFVTSLEADGSAKVELYEWSAGDWKQAKSDKGVTVGQALSFGTGKNKISYDGIVINVDPKRAVRVRSEDHNGAVSFKDPDPAKELGSMALVNSQGDVEEHVLVEDANARRRFGRDKTEEERFYREHATAPKLTRSDVISGGAAPAGAAGEAPAGGATPGAGAGAPAAGQ